jgi:molecular chaperone GrpE
VTEKRRDSQATPAPEEPEAPVSGFEEEREEREQRGDEPDESVDAEASAVEDDIGQLLEKARERDEYLSLAQRTQADFENYRKRAAKEMAAAEARGVAKLARELLPALDNLALALASGDAGEEFLKGIRLVQSEMVAALERVGIEPYDPSGERFDPEVHEAMGQQVVEGAEPGTVVEVGD